MSRTKIRIQTRHDDYLFISANVLEGGLIAVHPFILNESGDQRKGWYTVTHIPTGKSIVPEIRGRERAMHCAKLVNLPCLKGDNFKPIPKDLKKALSSVKNYLKETRGF